MKIPVQLSKGLTEKEKSELESALKNSVLTKQLRMWLQDGIKACELAEEMISAEIHDIYSLIGQRRGFRKVLDLLPEDNK